MKTIWSTTIMAALASGLLVTGCGSEHEHGNGHAREKEAAGHGHGHEEAPSGATFKAGKGVILTEETGKILGVETAEVTERKLPVEIRFNAHVFGETHVEGSADTNHTECTFKASGLVSPRDGALLRKAEPVRLLTKSGEVLGGFVLSVNKALALGDVEVVVGVTNAVSRLKQGEFVPMSISMMREQPTLVVPEAGLLRAAEGTFVYTLNGDAYMRTPVKTGAEAEGFVEIIDGLLAGDVVVTKPVKQLWLIELRATKGGGHSH